MAGLSQEKRKMYLKEVEELERILEDEEDEFKRIVSPEGS